MKIPRDLYGRDLAAVLCRRWGYAKVHQVGSHIILQTESPAHHRLSVPDHKPLRLGTLNAILREVAARQGRRPRGPARFALTGSPKKPSRAPQATTC